MNEVIDIRELTKEELAIIRHLLSEPFQGREILETQLEKIKGKTIDQEGSIQLFTQSDLVADCRRIPVEGRIEDEDGITINLLIHVLNGKLAELEIYKDDSSPLIRKITPTEIELLHLEG